MHDILRKVVDMIKKETVQTYRGKIIDIKEVTLAYSTYNPGRPNEMFLMQYVDMPRLVVSTERGEKLVPINPGFNIEDEVLVTETQSRFGTELTLEKVLTKY